MFENIIRKNAKKLIVFFSLLVLSFTICYLLINTLLYFYWEENLRELLTFAVTFSFIIFIPLTVIFLLTVTHAKEWLNNVRFFCVITTIFYIFLSSESIRLLAVQDIGSGGGFIALFRYFIFFPLIFLFIGKQQRKIAVKLMILYGVISLIALFTVIKLISTLNILTTFTLLGVFSLPLLLVYSPLLWSLINKEIEIRILVLYNVLQLPIIIYILGTTLLGTINKLNPGIIITYSVLFVLLILYLAYLLRLSLNKAKVLDQLFKEQGGE